MAIVADMEIVTDLDLDAVTHQAGEVVGTTFRRIEAYPRAQLGDISVVLYDDDPEDDYDYTLAVYARTHAEADAGVRAIYEKLVATTPWGLHAYSTDGDDLGVRPPLLTTAA